MYYVVNVAGYETYSPHWFNCNCSKEEFEKIVSESIDKAVDELVENESDSSICGMNLMDHLLPILEKNGFKEIKIDHEISIGGECLYREKYDGQEIFLDKTWKKILNQNAKIHKDSHDEYKKEQAEREAKKSKLEKTWNAIIIFLRAILYKTINVLSKAIKR
jgi:hypothetical protein